MAEGSAPEGLYFNPDFISLEEEAELLKWLDSHKWENVNKSNPKSRRVQQYGYGYGYRSHSLTPGPPMEGPILDLANRMKATGFIEPIQCIVNEYYRDQGIAAHIDSKNFGPTVFNVSMGAPAILKFKRDGEVFDCYLPPRSLVVMTGEARYSWTHEISSNLTYMHKGKKITKPLDYRRISLTYRELKNTN